MVQGAAAFPNFSNLRSYLNLISSLAKITLFCHCVAQHLQYICSNITSKIICMLSKSVKQEQEDKRTRGRTRWTA
jgi:hypothetical protein